MSCNRHGVVAPRLQLERQGSVIPPAKPFTVFGALHRFSHSKYCWKKEKGVRGVCAQLPMLPACCLSATDHKQSGGADTQNFAVMSCYRTLSLKYKQLLAGSL